MVSLCPPAPVKSCYAVKIGGSVTTVKRGSYQFNDAAISSIASTLVSCREDLALPLILVFGGGSFGNVAPVEHGLVSIGRVEQPPKLAMMTVTMFGMLSRIAERLLAYGVPVYPLQTSALVVKRLDGMYIDARALCCAMSEGYIPLLSGDMVFSERGGYQLVSSDDILPLLSRALTVERALYYTDVEGIYDPDDPCKKVIPVVHGGNAEWVKGMSGLSSVHDLTGGMAQKFKQLRALAISGVEAEVLSFRHFPVLADSLRAVVQHGTIFKSGSEKC
ncbi:Amino acid kinase family protein [compost metagenome]